MADGYYDEAMFAALFNRAMRLELDFADRALPALPVDESNELVARIYARSTSKVDGWNALDALLRPYAPLSNLFEYEDDFQHNAFWVDRDGNHNAIHRAWFTFEGESNLCRITLHINPEGDTTVEPSSPAVTNADQLIDWLIDATFGGTDAVLRDLQDLIDNCGFPNGDEKEPDREALPRGIDWALYDALKAKNLPPDPEGENKNRSDRAYSTLDRYRQIAGSDWPDILSDLLCDLMHWADRNGQTFATELNRARMHYEAETAKV